MTRLVSGRVFLCLLFRLADEAYATANAEPQLKAMATAVIGSNEQDGVAHWLQANAHPAR